MDGTEAVVNGRVLLVEDDEPIRSALASYLETRGYAVDCAENGRDGLERLAGRDVDLVVTDIMMPEMNGIAMLEKVKQTRPDVDVVMITGYADVNIAIEAMKKGASDFIAKPFQFESLERVLDGLVARRASKKQAPPAEGAVPVSDRERDLGRILERKIQELSVLQSINEALEKLDGSEQLFRNICEIARHLCGAKTAAYYVYDRDNDALVQHKAVPPEAGIARKTVLRLPPKLRRRVLGERVPFVVDNAADLSAMFAGPVGGERTPRSALVAPFYVRDEYFGVLVLEDKDSGGAYEADDVTYLRMLFKKAGITIENQALYETIYSNLVSTLHSLVSTIEAKDPYTRFHSERVTRLSVLIGKEMGCDEAALETLRFAGSLHDIGKIGVPDTILQKPSGLTKEEFDAIKMHPIVGERILEPLGMLPEEQSIIRHHHERWDGRGYPDGLAGTDIPFLVRIVSLADSYDAMTSDRAYRKGMDHAVAMEEIVRTAGAQFDPNVVLAMRSICKRISNIKMHLGSDKILQMGGVLH